MSWTCPKCERTFANKDSWHSCVKIGVEDHFVSKPELRLLYDKIYQEFGELDGVFVEAVKGQIMFKCPTSFLSIKVKKDHLQLSFALSYTYDAFPVLNTFQYSKNRIVHTVALYDVADLDKTIRSMILEAYALCKD